MFDHVSTLQGGSPFVIIIIFRQEKLWPVSGIDILALLECTDPRLGEPPVNAGSLDDKK